jgi:hypothetical protein
MPAASEPPTGNLAPALARVTILADPLIAQVVAAYPDTVLLLPVVLDLGSATLTIAERSSPAPHPDETGPTT